jgi:hypothetical protein
MRKLHATCGAKVLAAVLLFAGAGVANASTTNLDTVGTGTYNFGKVLSFGESFTDYVNFTLDDSAEVSSFIKPFNMSFFNFDLLGIDNFSARLQSKGAGGSFTTLLASAANPISFDDFLGPGSYRLAIAGTASGFFGGVYRGTLQVAAVPEAETWLMILIGFGIVLYQLGRKQRSLERQQPLLA